MSRRRAPAQRAPQSKDQAVPILERYAVIMATIAMHDADRAEQLARINGAADQAIAPLEVEAKDLFGQLKIWWAVESDDVTRGKQRSAELGGCQIGYRLTPPKLTHGHAKDGEAAIALRATSYGEQMTKVSYTLDKAAILRRIDEEADAKALALAATESGVGHIGGPAIVDDTIADVDQVRDLAALGFASRQTDEFFVAPIVATTAA